jgi:hypothetical protein
MIAGFSRATQISPEAATWKRENAGLIDGRRPFQVISSPEPAPMRRT